MSGRIRCADLAPLVLLTLVLLTLVLLAGCAAPPPLPPPPLPLPPLAPPAACAPPPRALREPPLSYPPAARERMLRIVLAEWAEWGGLEVTAGQRPVSTRAESDPANFPRVLAY